MSHEINARKLFKVDNSTIARRDRQKYLTFDDMPAGLRQWWIDRAKNYAIEGKYGLGWETVLHSTRSE